ncbi:unnamed protein product [Musa acuminata subsp. malaccensis]|uniref:(wild Malaysian banana) hypothetical protein n=1 Tax=Musa acuminata subsp. malaccensis TaxID=214687 RepID=A0A804HZ30_MUSAM|nr:PREDICTED: uncharacterized protein LOC103969915 [Musa acuminata subsp. malaccensis]CAG1861045.1 unnamed protein product [Musa acuminata subsp. malaccensis]
MAGLSVLLEAQKNSPTHSHLLISQTSLGKNTSSSSSSSSSSFSTSSFLEHCFLCRRRLQEGSDIFMYRGDRAFCSEECRCRHMFVDEESRRAEHCSSAAPASAAGKGRATPGGFAY